MFVFEFRRWQRRGLSRHAIDRNLILAVVGVLVVSTVSGGLESPFLPVLLVVTVDHRRVRLAGPGHLAHGARHHRGLDLRDPGADPGRPRAAPGGARRRPTGGALAGGHPGGHLHHPAGGRALRGARRPPGLRPHAAAHRAGPGRVAPGPRRAGRGAHRPLRRDRPRAQEPARQREGAGRAAGPGAPRGQGGRAARRAAPRGGPDAGHPRRVPQLLPAAGAAGARHPRPHRALPRGGGAPRGAWPWSARWGWRWTARPAW